MSSKKWILWIPVLLLLVAMPVQALAKGAATARIPFQVKNAPGTLVLEAQGNAPLPEQTRWAEAEEGEILLAFDAPGTYGYTVRQEAGGIAGATYDETVYEIQVGVFVDENEQLYTVTAVNAQGSTQKVDDLVFENTLPPRTPDGPQTGDQSHPALWLGLMVFSFLAMVGSFYLYRRAK